MYRFLIYKIAYLANFYKPEDTNPINRKTYGKLYKATLEREKHIRDLGYTLVVIWEHEWNDLKKTIPKDILDNINKQIVLKKLSEKLEDSEEDSEDSEKDPEEIPVEASLKIPATIPKKKPKATGKESKAIPKKTIITPTNPVIEIPT